MRLFHFVQTYVRLFICLFLLTILLLPNLYAENDLFEEGLSLLTTRSYSDKQTAVEKIMESEHENAGAVFRALLDSKLYYTKIGNSVVIVENQESGDLKTTDVISGNQEEEVNKRTLKKITINNKMRSYLKTSIAALNLNSPDPALRQASINEMIDNISEDVTGVLQKRLKLETDPDIKESIRVALAIIYLHSEDAEKRMSALDQLEGSLHPSVRQAINELLKSEEVPEVKEKAEDTLKDINSSISYFRILETVFFGLSMGSVLVLASFGLAITFGVIGVINMAHGELIMIGAYTTFVIQQLMPNSLSISLFVAVPAAFLVSGLVGIAIEKGIIRFLYGRPLETLLATFGVSLVLQQAVRSIFSPLNRTVETPVWMRGSLEFNSVFSLTINRLTILVFCFLVFGVLNFIMKKTSVGLQVRAISQNRSMARAMGVKAARVDALTFGLGSGIAGIAGVALSQLTNVGPNLGQNYIVDSFMVVVFGGVGNLWGTVLGGLTLGIANKFLEPFSGAVLAKIFILIFIILFIQKRPQGLFPQKGRAAGG